MRMNPSWQAMTIQSSLNDKAVSLSFATFLATKGSKMGMSSILGQSTVPGVTFPVLTKFSMDFVNVCTWVKFFGASNEVKGATALPLPVWFTSCVMGPLEKWCAEVTCEFEKVVLARTLLPRGLWTLRTSSPKSHNIKFVSWPTDPNL